MLADPPAEVICDPEVDSALEAVETQFEVDAALGCDPTWQAAPSAPDPAGGRRWYPGWIRRSLSGVPTPILAGTSLAIALALALLLAPPMGTDLSAQVARAEFLRRHGLSTPVDLRWYGGTIQYGYSWLSPTIMALLGARLAGALAQVASTIALGILLVRCGARRPMIGTLLGAVAFAGNLVSGRTTYAIGVAFGLWALVALTPGRSGSTGSSSAGSSSAGSSSTVSGLARVPVLGSRLTRLSLAGLGALLASAVSPPAGLFLMLAGVALGGGRLLARQRPRWGSLVAGGTLALAAAVPLGATFLLAREPGVMNISTSDATHAIVTGLVVAWVVRVPALRLGGLLAAVMVLGAYVVPSPVGLNSTRLAIMFVLPVIAGFGEVPEWLSRRVAALWRPGTNLGWVPGAAGLLIVALWQPPLLVNDLVDAGNPTADRAYFTPLLAELARRQPVGRVEIPPTRDYWESAYVADEAPLARGWLRQVDITRNPLFFPTDSGHTSDSGYDPLDPAEYYTWLVDNGVSYVALPDARLSWVGWREAELIASGPDYLREVWRGDHWVLFAVAGSPTIVEGATLVSSTSAAVTFDAPAAGEILVKVTPSRWLRVYSETSSDLALTRHPHPCAPPRLVPRGRWTAVQVSCPGQYTVTS